MTQSKLNTLSRREFITTSLMGTAALSLAGCSSPSSKKLLLIRYDVESRQKEEIAGFFEKMVAVHREHQIPASFFCLGAAMKLREAAFRSFFSEVKDDPLFDIQDHSYSHVGLGYDQGISVDELRADFVRSFDLHEQLRGTRPIGVSKAGTGSRDGESVGGFDATEKSRAELDMLADLGVRMINTFHSKVDGSKTFINYRDLGHPEIMGFPSGGGDNGWLRGRNFGDPEAYILSQIKDRGEKNEHLPIMFHDDTVWIDVNDKTLKWVRLIADAGRKAGFELVTHKECYERRPLWAEI